MYLSILLIVSLLYPANPKVHNTNLENNSRLTNPMLDRAKGYALMGKAKSAVSNYGNYTDWDLHPAGLWGDYTYLPSLSLLAGVPGQKYSSEFTWEDCSGISDVSVWCSNDAYVEWLEDTYVGIVFDSADDRGIVGSQVDSISEVDDQFQWGINSDENYIFISVIDYDDININPNYSNARIGFIYPWALRPALSERLEEFDLYESRFISDGYEGMMVRNQNSLYKYKHRSYDLQKVKRFVDKEFKIIGGKDGTGRETGLVIFKCVTNDGSEFDVRPMGTHEDRAEVYKNLNSYIGKDLTVKYQELTDDGIPRFPVGISVRDYE